jgi:hypothetical protein
VKPGGGVTLEAPDSEPEPLPESELPKPETYPGLPDPPPLPTLGMFAKPCGGEKRDWKKEFHEKPDVEDGVWAAPVGWVGELVATADIVELEPGGVKSDPNFDAPPELIKYNPTPRPTIRRIMPTIFGFIGERTYTTMFTNFLST